MDNVLAILPLVGIALVFWLLMVRPAQRRQREQVRLQSSIGVGDRVMLTSGIHGSISAMDDDTVSLEVAPGVTLEVARAAVGTVVDPVSSAAAPPVDEPGLVSDEPEEK